MDSKLRQKIIYVLFGLAIIYGGYNFLSDHAKKKIAPPPATAEQSSAQLTPPAKSIDVNKYSLMDWGRDPFYRHKASEQVIIKGKPGNWVLNGILYDPSAPTAIINKQIVRPGDKIGRATVEEITKSKVIIKIDDTEYRTLEISKEKS